MNKCIKCNNENPNVTYVPAKAEKINPNDILDEHLLVQCPCGRIWTTPCADQKRKKTEVFLD